MGYEKNKYAKKTIFLSLFAVLALIAACTTTPTVDVVQQVPQIPAIELPGEPIAPAGPASSRVIPTIELVAYPNAVTEGETIAIRWRADSATPLIATHTGIHYDVISHPGSFDTSIGPADSGYPSLTPEYASGIFELPEEFSANIVVPAGDAFYYRAHIIVDGMNYWTDEYSAMMVLKTMSSETAAPIVPFDGAPYKEYVFLADNKGLYPNEINLTQGENVKFTFRVLTQNVNPDGLEFTTLLRDVWGTTRTVPVGEARSVYFTAEKSFRFGVYFPGAGLEQVGTVTVLDKTGNIIGAGAIGETGMSSGYSY